MRVIIPESARKSNDRMDSDSIISKRHDCLPCRLLSGFGVIGIGNFYFPFLPSNILCQTHRREEGTKISRRT